MRWSFKYHMAKQVSGNCVISVKWSNKYTELQNKSTWAYTLTGGLVHVVLIYILCINCLIDIQTYQFHLKLNCLSLKHSRKTLKLRVVWRTNKRWLKHNFGCKIQRYGYHSPNFLYHLQYTTTSNYIIGNEYFSNVALRCSLAQ